MILDEYLDYLNEAPVWSICGRQCNDILGMGYDLRYTKGALVGSLVAGPFGMMYGGARPAEALQKLCRVACKKQIDPDSDAEIYEAKQKVEKWILFFDRKDPKKAALMRDRYSRIMGTRFNRS